MGNIFEKTRKNPFRTDRYISLLGPPASGQAVEPLEHEKKYGIITTEDTDISLPRYAMASRTPVEDVVLNEMGSINSRILSSDAVVDVLCGIDHLVEKIGQTGIVHPALKQAMKNLYFI